MIQALLLTVRFLHSKYFPYHEMFHLLLGYNQIASIPSEIGMMTNLETLWLGEFNDSVCSDGYDDPRLF
jgi:hypothetical protein